MNDVTIAKHGDLFCIPCEDGYTCLGFDVCIDRTARLATWLASRASGRYAPIAERGTLESYAEYQRAMDAARVHCHAHNVRCDVELSPQLTGHEGRRVEVVDSKGDKPRRFIVGKSGGWLPCHLEISRRNSRGGPAAMRHYASVRVLEYVL
jgi:hypothetical protein